jgi:hypothetical protein
MANVSLCVIVAAMAPLKKFYKIILVAYFIPYFAFLLFSDFESAEKKFPPGVFNRAFSIYFFVGIFVLPILIFGIPSVASIKAEIQSVRVRRGAKRKLQIVIASIAVTIIWGLVMVVVPPQNTRTAVFDIFIFLLLFGSFLWLRSKIKSG